jgi:hypothetical protein
MAKRHHGGVKRHEHEVHESRMHERSEHRHDSLGAEHYAGHDPRRRQELEDAGMIREDHSAMSNLPQGVIMRPYPRLGGYTPEDLEDTIRGVDGQIELDNRMKMRHFSPKKV